MHCIIEILKIVSILIAAFVGLYGINSWRREIKWKRKYELAEEVLSIVYETEDAFRAIRNPFSWGNESSDRKRDTSETTKEATIRDRAYIVYERYNANKDTFNRLRSIKYRFLTIYGKENEELFNRIGMIMNDIFFALSMLSDIYWRSEYQQMEESEQKRHVEEKRKYEKVIWTTGDTDELGQKINTAIHDFERVCKNIIDNLN